jgi:hypothetical protein
MVGIMYGHHHYSRGRCPVPRRYGHDDDGRLPLPLFCQRVFASEAHVASLEGAKAGAFTADDAAYRWQVHAALRGSQR